MRIDKFLANHNKGTRKEVKQFIKQGRILIDGQVITDPGYKMGELDVCTFDGVNVNNQTFAYYMLNKPAGVVSATIDNVHSTVLDLIHEPFKDLFPVGRLDIDTTGLLLITNDGGLAHRALSPKHHVPKSYLVGLNGEITPDLVKQFQQGFDFGEKRVSKPATVVPASKDQLDQVIVTIVEGKFHQIKRMFMVQGFEVKTLSRISFASLKLDSSLKMGQYRPLTTEEIATLKGYIYAE